MKFADFVSVLQIGKKINKHIQNTWLLREQRILEKFLILSRKQAPISPKQPVHFILSLNLLFNKIITIIK